MNEHIKLNCSIPERGLDNITGQYYVDSGVIRIFFPMEVEIPPFVEYLYATETYSNTPCIFGNIRLHALGRQNQLYIAEELYHGETVDTYKKNEYSICTFRMTSGILLFFERLWDLEEFSAERSILKFMDKEKSLTIPLTENITLDILLYANQSHSQTQYEVSVSHKFKLTANTPVSREHFLDLIYSLCSFFSLFFTNQLPLTEVTFGNPGSEEVVYYGPKVNDTELANIRNGLLLEKHHLSSSLHDLVPRWVADFEKNRIPIGLLIDFQKVTDQQLKFLCLTRCLEIYHVNHFVKVKPTPDFMKELYQFAIDSSLTDYTLEDFSKKEIKFVHRLFDLIRDVYHHISDRDYLFLFNEIISQNSKNKPFKIIETRNHLTHFGKPRFEIFTDTLPIVNYQLNAFIKVLLLHQIQMSKNEIELVIIRMKNRLLR